MNLVIRNPYNTPGEFTVRYIESEEPLLSPEPSVVVNARRKLVRVDWDFINDNSN